MNKLDILLSLIKCFLKNALMSALGLIVFLALIYFITNPKYLGIGTNPDSPEVPISTFKFN